MRTLSRPGVSGVLLGLMVSVIPATAARAQQPAADLDPRVDLSLDEVRYTEAEASDLLDAIPTSFSFTGDAVRFLDVLRGLTVYRMHVRWSSLATDEGCIPVRTGVDLDMKIFLPAKAASLALRELKEHEYAHRDAVLAASGEILERLDRLRAPDCADLDRRARAASDEVRDRLDAAHMRIDGPGRRGGNPQFAGVTVGVSAR